LRYALKMAHPSESEVRPATILVDVQLQKTPPEEHDASLQELTQLIETLRWDIVGTLTQKLQYPTAASLIGPGKLEGELVIAPCKAESVVFDHELTPTQVRSIREATGVEV
jgi:GTPase